jgi:hypothetical protein
MLDIMTPRWPRYCTISNTLIPHNTCNITYAKKPSPAQFYEKRKKTMKQNATKLPMMMPSLLFLADILPISVLIPGT